MKILEVKNLTYSYPDMEVLEDVSFTVDRGDFLAISGENGSGKSTLIKILVGALKKEGGEVNFFFDKGKKRPISYLPQVNDKGGIAFPLTCREYVSLNLYPDFSKFNRPGKDIGKRVEKVFEDFNLSNLIDRPLRELSGGQQQKVMIASALVSDPDLLILDEPTVGVDKKSKEEFLKLLGEMNKKQGLTIIIISHEMEVLSPYISRKLYLKEGRIYA